MKQKPVYYKTLQIPNKGRLCLLSKEIRKRHTHTHTHTLTHTLTHSHGSAVQTVIPPYQAYSSQIPEKRMNTKGGGSNMQKGSQTMS